MRCLKGLTDNRELARISHTESGHELERIGCEIKVAFIAQQGGPMGLKVYRATMEHHTATLDRLNEVFATLGNEAEPGLMGVEFQNTAERLLGDHRKIVGIIEKHPGGCIGHGSDTADEFGQALANGGDAAIIGRREAEGHRVLMNGVCDSLVFQMFRNPGVREHRFADTRGATEYDVRRILNLRSQKGDRVLLTENSVHCFSDRVCGFSPPLSERQITRSKPIDRVDEYTMGIDGRNTLHVRGSKDILDELTASGFVPKNCDTEMTEIAERFFGTKQIDILHRDPHYLVLDYEFRNEPVYQYLEALLRQYPTCWFKNTYKNDDGSCGLWIGRFRGSELDVQVLEWMELCDEEIVHETNFSRA